MYRVVGLIIGYLFGCIQTAFIIGKLKGKIDIRQYGSGSSGTTNAIRVMGWKWGILTFLGDVAKAVIAVLVSWLIFDDILAGFYGGIGAILGHNFPVFLKFKGGKGIASTLGVLLIVDYRIGLIAGTILAIGIFTTKFVSVGSILMSLSIPIQMIIFHPNWEYIILGSLITASALILHRDNIKRLLTGTENKIGHKKNIINNEAK